MVLSHEKEARYNEIMLRLLITENILYKNMPIIQLYKCTRPINDIPTLIKSKTHEKIPFEDLPKFYKPDPFKISSNVNYGLPKFRKISHLTVSDDFVHIGNVMNLDKLDSITSFDDLLKGGGRLNLTDLFSESTTYKGNINQDLSIINPMLSTLGLLYKYQFKKILDSRPVPVRYGYLNP